MADQHPALVIAPRELLWRAVTAVVEDVAVLVGNLRVAVDDVAVGGDVVEDVGEQGGGGEGVAAVDVQHVGAGGEPQPLVHSVVETLVRLGDDDGDAVAVFVDYLHRRVLALAVDDDVFHPGIILPDDALDGAADVLFAVVNHRYYAYLGHCANQKCAFATIQGAILKKKFDLMNFFLDNSGKSIYVAVRKCPYGQARTDNEI